MDDLAKKKGRGKFGIEKLLDRNLIGDGICDMVSGAVGGPAGTNYGENISTMAITKVISGAKPAKSLNSGSLMKAASMLVPGRSCWSDLRRAQRAA